MKIRNQLAYNCSGINVTTSQSQKHELKLEPVADLGRKELGYLGHQVQRKSVNLVV